MRQTVDNQKYRASMARLQQIFAGIADTADKVSTRRCLYKNAQDRCTAAFLCRNQLIDSTGGELFICTGSDDLDYRSAWES